MITRWYRNINLLSIAYAFRPQLRSRLTLSGRAFLRKPYAFGERDAHSFFVTHTGILTSKRSTSPYGLASLHLERSPTIVPTEHFAASGVRVAPIPMRRDVSRPVSSYSRLRCWLLLRRPPGRPCSFTSLSTSRILRDLSSRSGLLPSRRTTSHSRSDSQSCISRIRSLSEI